MRGLPLERSTAVLVLLFLFGASVFVYEIVWVHLLGLVMENAVYAHAAVLAVFMAAVGAGAVVGGRYSDKLTNPLRVFALLALLLSFLSFISPWVIELTGPVFGYLYRELHDSPYILNTIRFLLYGVILVLPAGLFGAALPVVMSFEVRGRSGVGTLAGGLYGLCGLGAASGTIISGFILLPAYGYTITLDIAVALNMVVAMGAYLLSIDERGHGESLPGDPLPEEEEGVGGGEERRAMRLAPVLTALFVTLVSGVVYIISVLRTLTLIFDTTIYSLIIVIAAFVLAISLGSLLFYKIKDLFADRVLLLAAGQFLLALSILAITSFVASLPVFAVKMSLYFSGSFYFYRTVQFFLVLAFFFVPSFLIGATVSGAARVYMSRVKSAGRDVSVIFVINFTGAILGLLAALFFLLPHFGARSTLLLVVLLNMVFGAVLVFFSKGSAFFKKAFSATAVIVLPPLFLVVPEWDLDHMSSGPFIYASEYAAGGSASISEEMKRKNSSIYFKEGTVSTVTVTKSDDGSLTLRSDGIIEATDRADDLVAQELLADLALMLHDDPKEVLIVGLGSGAPLEAATGHPVDRIDCVEVSVESIEAARLFRSVNAEAFLDWRVNLMSVDGRVHMDHSEGGYDVILSTPSVPWDFDMGWHFTKEYFESAAGKLNDGGVMVQWVKTSHLTSDGFKTVVRTFLEAFPFAAMWETGGAGGDFILMGSMRRLLLDYEEIRERFEVERAMHGLEETGISSIFTLLNLYVMDDSSMRAYSWGAPVNTDDKSTLLFSSARALQHPSLRNSIRGVEPYRVPPFLFLSNVSEDVMVEISNTRHAFDHIRSADDFLRNGDVASAVERLELAILVAGENRDILKAASKRYLQASTNGSAAGVELLEKAIALDPASGKAWYRIGRARLDAALVDGSIEALSEARRLRPRSARVRLALAEAYEGKGLLLNSEEEREAAAKLVYMVDIDR